MSQIKKVCVIGLGYIGLPTAAILAQHGYEVSGVDVNPDVAETINKGQIHIVERDLDAAVSEAVSQKKLKAFTAPQAADVFIICVPTPFKLENGNPKPDLSYVLSAAESIAPLLKVGDRVILESTSPVGATHQVKEIFESHGMNIDNIHIAYCPERVLPGKILHELVHNDRIVGGINPKSTEAVAVFYESFVQGKVLKAEAKTAEMCKLVENSYRDVNIAFANELSMICDDLDINVEQVIDLANHHPRVNILRPGVGVGGHCIAVDPWFIVASSPEKAKLIRLAREVNNHKTDWVIQKICDDAEKCEKKNGCKPKIACLGLAYKPDVDDLRESPALKIVLELIKRGHDVVAVEPHIEKYEGIDLVTFEKSKEIADLSYLLVNHRGFL